MKDYRPMRPKEWRQFIQDVIINIVCILGFSLCLVIFFGKHLAE